MQPWRHLRVTFALALAAAAAWGQIVDRTVAIVADEAITRSDVELQLRLEAMANGVEFIDSPELRESVLNRLIDQRLIARDIRLTGLQPLSKPERERAMESLRGQDFGGLAFDAALERYGVSSEQALEFFVRQVEFARYVDFRFRTGQTVSAEELREGYEERYGRLAALDAPPLEQVEASLRQEILERRVEALIEERVRQLRADSRLVLLTPIDRSAFAQGGGG